MPGKDARPLNGNEIDPSTSQLANNQPGISLGTDPTAPGKTPEIQAAEANVSVAMHGLIFNLLPDPSNPLQWTDSVLVQVLLKDNIFEDVLKKYTESVANGRIDVSSKGKATVTRGWDSPSQKLREAGTAATKDRVMQAKQVKKLQSELQALAKLYGAEIHSIFVKKDWSQMCVVVATATVLGAIVAGMVDYARSKKDDNVASAVTGLSGIIPDQQYEVGTLTLKAGTSDISWKPAEGIWSVKAFASGDWVVKKGVTLRGRVEVSGSQKGRDGKANIGATFNLGTAFFDSVSVDGTALPAGHYELTGQLNKSYSVDKSNAFDFYAGAKYQGRYRGEPARDNNQGLSFFAGVKYTFGGK